MITQLYSDDVVVNTKELSQNMRVSEWTVYRWKVEGYRFEFGKRTTTGHLKAWLRTLAESGGPPPDEDQELVERLFKSFQA